VARVDRAATALLVLTCAAIRLPRLAAQEPTPAMRIALGFGVDTARSPNREIFALYQHYLVHRLDGIQPNPDWSPSEQRRWPVFDLLSGYVYQGFSNFTVVHLAPAVSLDSTYLIRALVSSVDDSTHAVRPLALHRVYAVRESGRWVLANALPRITRKWPHETIGSVTFHYPPTHVFARARAVETSQFADSLARAFEVPMPEIEYYFTDDLIEMFRALGLEYFPIGQDTVGGRSNTADRQVYVGSSAAGETYRHELAHVVLQPLITRYHPPGILMEGLMTWTGGSAGLSFSELLPGLAGFLARHPEVTLDIVLTHPPAREGSLDVGYDGAAALCAMVFEKGGNTAVLELLGAGPSSAATLARAVGILNVSPASLDALWRGWIQLRKEHRTSRNSP
jgi:hypothetical protein